jgi:glycosyltransferase involved in cell wall biosynthesis
LLKRHKIITPPVIAVIIPAFNEAESITRVLSDIPKNLVSEVIVVDNNSDDTTEENARNASATVVNEPRQGYGYACHRGLEYLKSKSRKPDIVVFLDGDYSDYPEEMNKLIQPITEEGHDLVIGSRVPGSMEKGAMTPQQIFGNRLIVFLIRLLYGHRFTDPGPFRAIRFDKLVGLDIENKKYGWPIEMQLKALKQGFRIGKSKISGTLKGSLKAGINILITIFRYF